MLYDKNKDGNKGKKWKSEDPDQQRIKI